MAYFCGKGVNRGSVQKLKIINTYPQNLKNFFFNQIEHVIQISEFSYISEEIKMVYPSCAGYMNVQAPEETRDRTRLQLHQLCYSI